MLSISNNSFGEPIILTWRSLIDVKFTIQVHFYIVIIVVNLIRACEKTVALKGISIKGGIKGCSAAQVRRAQKRIWLIELVKAKGGRNG